MDSASSRIAYMYPAWAAFVWNWGMEGEKKRVSLSSRL
jgi:hypothetical protein